MDTSQLKVKIRLSDRICFRSHPRYCNVTLPGQHEPISRWNYWVIYMSGPVVTHEDVSVWLKIGGYVGGVFLSFVAGIVSATWVVANRVRDVEGKISMIAEKDKTREAVCENYRTDMKATIQTAVHDGIGKIQTAWGTELAGARDQRVQQALQLETLQAAVIEGNNQINRLHERIDEVLLRD